MSSLCLHIEVFHQGNSDTIKIGRIIGDLQFISLMTKFENIQNIGFVISFNNHWEFI